MNNIWLSTFRDRIDKLLHDLEKYRTSNLFEGLPNLGYIASCLRGACNEITILNDKNNLLREKIHDIEEKIYFLELIKEIEEDMPEQGIKDKGKPISRTKLYDLGISENNISMVKTTKELRKNPPNIIIAECSKSVKFTQNKFVEQKLQKKNKYVMSVGIYKALHYDKGSGSRILKPSSIKFKKIYKPYIGQDLTNKQLLISRTGGIGDLLFIQPSILHLKEKYPSCKIVLACGPQYHAMVENWDCLDKVYTMPYSCNVLFDSDYHAIFEGVIERCEEAHTTNALKLFSKWLGLNIPKDKLKTKQEPKKDKLIEVKNILRDWDILDGKFIIVQLEASSFIRTPRPKIWKNIINHLTSEGYKIIITDSPSKSSYIDDFIKTLERKYMVFNFAKHSKTLDYSIALSSLASLVIAPDSSFMHIAASLGTKCMGIYGAFTGEIRLSTYKDSDWINCKANCGPCFRHGPNPCTNSSGNYSLCYDNIDYKVTFEKIKNLLDKK